MSSWTGVINVICINVYVICAKLSAKLDTRVRAIASQHCGRIKMEHFGLRRFNMGGDVGWS